MSLIEYPGKKKLLFFLIGHLLMQCTQENPALSHPRIEYPGMKYMEAKGESVVLGSRTEEAQLDEKPESFVRFTYDFSIDSAEVTIDSYRELMGSIPREYDSLSVVDEQWPVTYVSWYDAVLYCNSRSKHHDLDTVYSYISIERTSQGDVFRLSGLQINYGRNGYRLPTEAEWLFAARGSSENEYLWGYHPEPESAEEHAWYIGNSGDVPHAVATRVPNLNGIHDMAGNASEWINESKIPLTGKTVTDLVGGDDIYAAIKILKGGSFHHDLPYLRLASRSDLYTVEAQSRNRYSGFRCAAGIIAKPFFVLHDSQVVRVEPVYVVTPTILQAAGTNRAKLVFVNKTVDNLRTLCFIDYTESQIQIHHFFQPSAVFNPTISPDGEWVCWSNRAEGTLGNGSITVRRLRKGDTSLVTLPDTQAFVPRWFVDPVSRDTFILYVSSAQQNDQISWSVSQTKMIRFEDGRFTDAPVVIEPEGAYHGGRSADGTFLATGFPLLKMKNLSTGESRILFHAPLNGKRPGDTSQVCNVSISPVNDQVLFLDFGSGRDTSSLTGDVYSAHEYLFLGDFSGRVLSLYRVTAPYYAWDHPEWSNRHHLAAATATTPDGAHRVILCLNLKTSKTTPLCEGTDLYHPYLWIDPIAEEDTTSLDPDSLGQYDSPHLSVPQAIMAFKMRFFWHYAESLEVIFTGSSVASNGVDPRHFSMNGYNMGIGAGDPAMSLEFIREYALNLCPRLKIVGMSLDVGFFFEENAETSLYPAFIQSRGYLYDKSNNFWTLGRPPGFESLINAVAIPPTVNPNEADSLGLWMYECPGWGATTPVFGSIDVSIDDDHYHENLRNLVTTIELCAAHGVKVLLATFPMHPGYRELEAYSPFGPSQTTARAMIAQIDSIAEAHENLYFYDAHLFGAHDYAEYEFFDYLHLCPEGAKKMSARLDSLFSIMLNE